jgi:CheY-like chemotaxis protein
MAGRQRRRRGRAPVVLVVEDDEDVRASVTELVQERGLAAEAFGDGAAALAYLRGGGAADLVLLDLRMPVLDGWAFAAEFRRLAGHEQTPVIVMTAAELLAQAPVSAAYLEKPLRREAVLGALDRCLPR